MNYNEAVSWIHGRLRFGIKPGIKRMQWVLNELGNPQNSVKGIHVVGTNGKGSTVNYLKDIFSDAGYKVGTFVSPALEHFRERISINGQMISEEDFLKLVTIAKPIIERLPKETELEEATEFEVITILMFLYFGKINPVDIAIIEAGLGGLHDSTNVFNPLAVIATSIGLDHQAILGQTYQEIAQHKAGVLKDKVPFIFSTERQDVKAVFYHKAKETNSPVYELNKNFNAFGTSDAFDFSWKNHSLTNISLAMNGQHQVSNASLAIMTSLLLKDYYPNVTEKSIKKSLSNSKWAGRTELIKNNILIDGAHNNESVSALVSVLKEHYKDRKIHILFAAIDTKPVDGMLKQLSVFEDITVTSFKFNNALTLDAYPSGYQRVIDYQTWLQQIKTAKANDLFVITGSLYFISQVRHFLMTGNDNLEI
ncbi:bifunctional folylpolyglutamate synthase/dihydrofolate synthase [Streptococcus sp. CSL10205-OR2]|uniref:bifunctional folylpolyglutamate synthase/dihydrofolate synthase n=1 Tax=Streptococcus sp. CSL10205-OR2 TaxID=2980558 RepID=UPI0021DB7F4C|nr:folylpolyglutamate synthase/dihydrofolate synthase family protein [Streptococcus sp. CSL10205-OR2]MCU9533179.1 bifunctional folylpolyglutamate synthase/dihydrofolate synthase [Streptococcus sp. CSL10205-OR2]